METHERGEGMENSVAKRLITPEETLSKIDEHMKEYEESRIRNDYRSMISVSYDIACLYELSEDREKSDYYYQKVVDEWIAHPDKFAESTYISALERLHMSKEALNVILTSPRKWGIETLARLYDELGRHEEALLLHAGMAIYDL